MGIEVKAPRFFTRCAPCEGDGVLAEPREETGLSAHSLRCDSDIVTSPCETCEHDGKVTCRTCDGAGDLPVRVSKLMKARNAARVRRLKRKARKLARRYESLSTAESNALHRARLMVQGVRECPACDGDGTVRCADCCDGDGYTWDSCSSCMESFDGEDDAFIGDGEIICYACAHKADDKGVTPFTCLECNGTGEIERTDVTSRGKTFPLTGASCSRCGGRPHNPGERDINGYKRDDAWFVAKAPMCDTDGVFYSFLCTSEDGSEGCLGDTLDEQDDVPKHRKELLGVLEGCMGDDIDGMAAYMQDLGPLAERLYAEDEGE